MAVGKGSASVPAESSFPAEYIRLHITPFSRTLLTALLPPSVIPKARNVSYHLLQTFPEKSYGFVDLPTMDAEKVKKRLNGSILRGTKVRIEEARPLVEVAGTCEVQEENFARSRKEGKDWSKKWRRGDETIPGVDIGDRSVKRGWTTPSASLSKSDKISKEKNKAVAKSKYTTGQECLFKTVIPPNKASYTKVTSASKKTERRKGPKAGKDAIVHEFSKSTKYATFLKEKADLKTKNCVAEFKDGQGWVDQDGNVVEETSLSPRKPTGQKQKGSKAELQGEGSQRLGEERTLGNVRAKQDDSIQSTANQGLPTSRQRSPTSCSGSSFEEEDLSSEDALAFHRGSTEGESSSEFASEALNTEAPGRKATSKSSSGPPLGLNIKIPASAEVSQAVAGEIHPLEALYKRPRTSSNDQLPKTTTNSFSFFGADGDGDEDMETESHDQVPLTPFTQKDFEYRGLRSAAPTPDTAHANRRFMWPTANDDEEEDEATDDVSSKRRKQSASQADGSATIETAETDFQKWFYEHRGETNRAWKKRRKAVAKEQRQRENRKRKDRTI